MLILLDIDGVLVTTPAWRAVELHADGFMKFNERAATNLGRIIDRTGAGLVLTTTHRIAYSLEEWAGILMRRGINPSSISKVNDVTSIAGMADRASEISAWVTRHGGHAPFVIVDDDLSINSLPVTIKNRCVLTKPMIGLDAEGTERALAILRSPLS